MTEKFAHSASDRNLWTICFIIFMVIKIILIFITPFSYFLDDAYIIFRYVNNFINDGNLYYNLGDSVFGISTILYPLLLAILSKVFFFIDQIYIVRFFNIIIELATIWILYKFLIRYKVSKLRAIFISFLALQNIYGISAVHGGVETSVIMLLIVLWIYNLDVNIKLAAIFSCLSLFARPEGAILIAITFCVNIWKHKSWKIPLFLFSTCMLYFTYFYLFYGSFIPSSVAVKYKMVNYNTHSSIYLLKSLFTLIPFKFLPVFFKALCLLFFSFVGMKKLVSKNYSFLFVLIFLTTYLFLFSLNNPNMWFWYSVPFISLTGIFFYYGVSECLLRFKYLKSYHSKILVIIGLILMIQNLKVSMFNKNSLLDLYSTRMKFYKEIVIDLNLSHDKSILTHEIGMIGHMHKGKIIDAVGLINPKHQSLGIISDDHKYKNTSNNKKLFGMCTWALIQKTKPDYLLCHEGKYQKRMLNSASFKDKYKFLYKKEHTSFNLKSGEIMVYKRIKKLQF